MRVLLHCRVRCAPTGQDKLAAVMERVLEMQGKVSAVLVAQPDNSTFCLRMRVVFICAHSGAQVTSCARLSKRLWENLVSGASLSWQSALEEWKGTSSRSSRTQVGRPRSRYVYTCMRWRVFVLSLLVFSHTSEGAKVGDADKEVRKGGCYKPSRSL